MCTTALFATGTGTAFAQEIAAQDAAAQDVAIDENVIVVTGSQIKGAKIDDILPVTVLDEVAIEATGADSGDDLFRAIPQAGTVEFNDQSSQSNSPNAARGDIASINLRGLGTGNTLLLINGRRMVLNPGFQTELFVPVVSSDTNEIAPGAVRRIEVLRDGASALYGADAVAGVVNTILKDNLDGGFLRANYAASMGTSLYNSSIRGGYGFDFNEGRSNLTLYGYYYHENGAPTSMRDYSASSDLRPFVEGTEFEGDANFHNRTSDTPWATFDIQGSGATSSNIWAIRDDDFHIQPCSFLTAGDTRSVELGNGLCADNGSSVDSDLRYDSNTDRSLYSEKDRYNISALFNHELSDAVEFYAEGSFYRSKSTRVREQSGPLSAVPLGVLSSAYYNPLGATTLLDGSPNPNRLDGLGSGVSDSGRDLLLENYRVIDAGPRSITVSKNTYRVVAGLKGDLWGWDFDTGFLYSQANTTDLAHNRISSSLLQDAINRNDATAYNPFNGGCLDNVNVGDCTPSNAQVLEDISIDVFRKGETTLALADFKVSRPDIFTLPAGDVGLAGGIEFRRETFLDDRDPRLDGTITFTNAVNGATNGSDVVGSSPTPDTSGNREVYSAFVETFVPLISEDMEIPLVHSLNLQLAGRFESFSDTSSTFVPRAAAAWTPFSGVILRGAWSRGFRAPNLIQVNDTGTTRSNSERPAVECVAELIKGIETDAGDCGTRSVVDYRTGDDLEPEKSQSINFGVVVSPAFIPGLTLTADYWRVKQTGIVGIFGAQNALYLDLVERLQGRSNPNVVRADPDADQLDLYAGTGILPAGDIIEILNPYRNLDSRVSKGFDFGVFYTVPDFGLGKFKLTLNAARLKSIYQTPGADGLPLLTELPDLLAAIPEVSAGSIATLRPEGFGEQLELDGRPKWRLSGSLNWRSGPVSVNLFGRYVGKIFDVGAVQDDTGAFYRVDDWFTMNASISYTINNDTALDGTRLKFGFNNIFDEEPPLSDELFGFDGALHSARGRQFRFEIQKKF
ncbi:TonB-dependent receptor [Sphingorhabdus sp. YGSMI21]|uniref:TonB-dependent receptor domain-containing protein n=1 Tax=Sphingorhabdus sp. YGSMI21 TaxID=2077182 RepID=UPI001F0C98F8|nr:TonB-dependent receptor [Sphingorhabdus sp. YGSMI21]